MTSANKMLFIILAAIFSIVGILGVAAALIVGVSIGNFTGKTISEVSRTLQEGAEDATILSPGKSQEIYERTMNLKFPSEFASSLSGRSYTLEGEKLILNYNVSENYIATLQSFTDFPQANYLNKSFNVVDCLVAFPESVRHLFNLDEMLLFRRAGLLCMQGTVYPYRHSLAIMQMDDYTLHLIEPIES